MKEIKTRDSVIVYFGKSRVKGIVIGQYEPEIFKNVFWIQLEDGSFIDAHRFQIRKLRKKRSFFFVKFQPPTISADGFSRAVCSLEGAMEIANKQQAVEIVECIEVRTIKAPPMPEFLKKNKLQLSGLEAWTSKPVDSDKKVP